MIEELCNIYSSEEKMEILNKFFENKTIVFSEYIDESSIYKINGTSVNLDLLFKSFLIEGAKIFIGDIFDRIIVEE